MYRSVSLMWRCTTRPAGAITAYVQGVIGTPPLQGLYSSGGNMTERLDVYEVMSS